MVILAMSDRAIPKSLRSMQGFGVHSFRLINAEGRSSFVKFHWRPAAGTCSLVWDEAQKLAGKDTDYHRRDQIGRAHVLTPVTNAHLVCRLLLEKKNKRQT